MQPFDGGEFDKRYDEVLVPAIEAADLAPYRVDRDPGAAIPIQRIEEGIKLARICLADISTEKMNVAFELGYAMARDKPYVLIAKKDTPRWFDIQHHGIIYYALESPRDFDQLRGKVTEALKARVAQASATETLPQVLTPTAGLDQHEVAVLVTLAGLVQSTTDDSSVYMIRKEMERLGYTDIATSLGIAALEAREFVEAGFQPGSNSDEGYPSCRVAKNGWDWLLKNKDKFELRRTAKKAPPKSGDTDYGDIPF